MKTAEFSTYLIISEVNACRDFYQLNFSAKAMFDATWYVNLRIAGDAPSIQFMQPLNEIPVFGGSGTMLNFNVDDTDKNTLD